MLNSKYSIAISTPSSPCLSCASSGLPHSTEQSQKVPNFLEVEIYCRRATE